MRKLYLFLVGCFLVSSAYAQDLPLVDFTGFTGTNLATVFPGWSEGAGIGSPSGTSSLWTRDDFANVAGNDAAKINLFTNTRDEWIISPTFLANSSSMLNFNLALTDFGTTAAGNFGSDDTFEVRASLDGGVTWTALATWTAAGPAISNVGQNESISLAAFAGQTMQIGFYGGDGPVNDPEDIDLFIDDVEILNPIPVDLQMVQITGPSGVDCFGTMETFEVEIKNTGTTAIDFTTSNALITVSTSGAAVNSYNTTLSTGTLDSDSSLTVVVTNMGDLSVPGAYTLTASATLPGDPFAGNDTVTAGVTTAPTITAPFLEDFETASPGSPGTFPTGWTTTTVNTSSGWFVETDGTTNSGNTGPLDDHTPGGQTYVYTETSSGNAGDTYTLTTPCIDLGTVLSPNLSFYYHMYGATMGTLKTSVIAGGVVTDLDSIVGQQQTGENDPWLERIVSLAAYQGQTIQIVFTGTRGTSFTGDMAMDDISIFQPLLDDIALGNASVPFGCSDAATASVTVEVSNVGINPATGVTAAFTVDGGAPSIPEIIPGTIAPGSTVTYTFTATADVSAPGPHQIAVGANLTGDGDLTNNTDTVDVNNSLISITAPFLEDFETATAGTPGTLPTGWTQTSTSQGWYVETDGVTNSSNTGPLDDHTPGGQTYVYTEASSGSTGQTYTLTSPCIDLGTLNNPRLSFWYHMYGADIGGLVTNVLVGATAIPVDSLIGEQTTGENEPWQERVIDLTAYAGQTIQLQFIGIRGAGFESDISLDDINIFEPPAFDLSLVSTNLGGAACGLDSFTVVSITVENVGVDTVMTGSAAYSLNGAAYTAAETIPGPIAPGAVVTYNFTALANMAAAGNYTLDLVATALMSPDQNTANDSLSTSVENIPSVTPSFPFQEDFEGPNLWTSGGTNSSWVLATPANDTINSAASGALSWVTGDTTDYNPNENSFVASPCFDMTNAPAGAWVSMQVWWESEFSWDGANLQTSTDGGVNWTNVGAFGDPNNWYTDNSINGNPGGSQEGWSGRNSTGDGSGGWVLAAQPLDSSLIGQNGVRFRVAFGADGSVNDEGFAFDDFTISVPPAVNFPDSLVVCGTETLDAGNPGSSYLWSTGDITQTLTLTNGTGADIVDSTVRVTVTDTFGLSTEAVVVVTIPASTPDVMASETTANLCNGDSIAVATAMTTGANGSVMYTWNTTPVQMGAMAMNLPAGSYTVTVTDSLGCEDVDTVLIAEPTAVAVALDTIVTPLCFGDSTGEISITTSGGTAPYTYMWDNGDMTEDLSGLPAGSYVGTITDANGCVLVSPSLAVGQPDSLTVALDALTDASCPDAMDGAISITTGGGTAPYSYLWDNGSMDEDLTGLAPGDYVGTITDDNGCELVSPTLTVGATDSLTTAGFSFAFTNGESVDFTNASSGNATSFEWDFGDGTTSTMENPSHTYTANGMVTVTLIATGPCGSDTTTQTVDVTAVGIDAGLARYISVYPNPTNGAFTVSFSEMNAQSVTVSVYTIHGKEVAREVSDQTVGNFNTQLDISTEAEGTYLLKVEVDGNMYMKQILKH